MAALPSCSNVGVPGGGAGTGGAGTCAFSGTGGKLEAAPRDLSVVVPSCAPSRRLHGTPAADFNMSLFQRSVLIILHTSRVNSKPAGVDTIYPTLFS